MKEVANVEMTVGTRSERMSILVWAVAVAGLGWDREQVNKLPAISQHP